MKISYTGFDTYRNCPLKYKFQEIDKIKTPKSKEAVFGTAIHESMKFIHQPGILYPTLDQALLHFSNRWNPSVFDSQEEERAAFYQGVKIIQEYYRHNKPSDFNVVDLESRFRIEIGDMEKHEVAGIIDRIDKIDDGYEIIDYKTTKKMPTQERVDNDIQLSLYLRAFLDRYPAEKSNIEKIKVSLYFLKHGVKLSSTRSREKLDESESMMLETIESIKEEKFEPRISPLCDWCGYQNICPMWKHKFKEQRKIDSEEINRAINEYIELKSAMKLTDDRLDKLQGLITRYMDQEEVERVFGENGVIQKTVRTSIQYDAERLMSILEPLGRWKEVAKVDGMALRKIIPSLPSEAKKEIVKASIVKESRSIMVKKK
jgi:putative RecB family exonuclease